LLKPEICTIGNSPPLSTNTTLNTLLGSCLCLRRSLT